MNPTFLSAVAEKIQKHLDTIQKNKDAIEQLNASNLIEMKEIQDLETARETFIKVMLGNAPTVQLVEKHIFPVEQVETVAEKPIVAQDSLSTDGYSSVDNRRKSNDKKLTDCNFNIRHLFVVKCIHKEKGKAKYNLYYEGQLLHWIDEKGEHNSTYMSGSHLTPFGSQNDEPFKASLFARANEIIKGRIFFRTQPDPISAETSAKNSAKNSELNMDDVSDFPSL
jgi:hypothetical protein